MSYVKIWIHCVWTTYKRIPYLNDRIRKDVILHIRENAISKGIYIDHINGYKEHLHALISLNCDQTVADIMHNIKGESSYWINRNNLAGKKFAWQDDYYAVSIGMSQIDNLRNYIRNQERHHKQKSLEKELELLIAEYQLILIKDGSKPSVKTDSQEDCVS